MKNLYLDAVIVHTSEGLAVSGFQLFHSKDVSTVTGCIHRVLRSTSRYVITHMKHLNLFILTLVLLLSSFSHAQATDAVASESRDASTAYLGTTNFVVGRVGRDCLALVGRSETPQAFVSVWQQRNLKYLAASQKYMTARLEEAEKAGGVDRRNTIVTALNSAVRSNAEVTVKGWLDRPDKQEACKRAVAFIESGAYDVSNTTPMFGELENLVSWATKQ